jgi:hypothetical protein
MKIKKLFPVAAVFLGLYLTACSGSEESVLPIGPDNPDKAFHFGLNWSQEEWDNTESDIMLGSTSGENLPAYVDLTGNFPPIGDQGEYGTCASWATGYYLKSYLEAKDQRTKPDSTDKQFSPKFLYWMLDDHQKFGCQGSTFEANLSILKNVGITTLSKVPYGDLGQNCTVDRNSLPSDWFEQADDYLIENYRKINHNDKILIKNYLADKRPVVFGAALGQNFIEWQSGDDVLMNGSDGVEGMHNQHAMILAGYDDSKGPSGAFLVVNSWGEKFGDKGKIWIDYDYFVNGFCFAAFVVKNKRSNKDFNPENPDNTVDSESDLLAWEVSVWDTSPSTPREKLFGYEIYNVGQRTVRHTERWSVMMIYYSAYDAYESNGICGVDSFSDEYEHREPLYYGTTQVGINYHFDLDTGINMGRTKDNAIPFTLPEHLNGYYHFAMMVDPGDAVSEYDESNNVLWWTDDPVYIRMGLFKAVKSVSPGRTKRLQACRRLCCPARRQRTANPQPIMTTHIQAMRSRGWSGITSIVVSLRTKLKNTEACSRKRIFVLSPLL